MTRVQKYHDYREEIANMKTDVPSPKKDAARKIAELRKNVSRLSYEQIACAYEIDNETKSNYRFRLSLDQILYGVVATTVITILIILIIIVK